MDSEQDVFARVEKKFWLSEAQAGAMAEGLRRRGFALLDFGSPAVQSVYYDTPECLLIRRSLERPNYKEKLRLRAYGQPGRESIVFLEIKKKYQQVVYKRRTSLRLWEAEQAMRGGEFPAHCGQIGREIAWCRDRYRLEPKALILYDRDAWASAAEPDVRVTFDRRIRFRTEALDVTAPQGGEPLLEEEGVLMEVKHPGVYPLWLIRLMEESGAQRMHISKYGRAYLQRLTIQAHGLKA